MPLSLAASAAIPLKVSHTASAEQEVVAILTSPTGTWLGNHKITVQKGSATLDMNITTTSNITYADDYNVTIMIRPVGSTVNEALDQKSQTIDISSTVALSPIHDAYLQGTTLFNNIDLRVENGNRVSYLQFDLSTIEGNIESMELQLTVGSDAGNGTINILDGSHSNWTETNLSNTNKPAQGASLDVSTGALAVGQTYSYDVSGVTVIGNKVTLVVTMNAGGNDVSFASKENTTQKAPTLKVKLADTVTQLNASEVENLQLYPNPTSNMVYLSQETNWELYSSLGILITTGVDTSIDLSELPSGIYFIKTGNGVERIVKQ